MVKMTYEELLRRAKEKLPLGREESRFEMTRAVVIQTGRRTIVKNFYEIAKNLRRDPKHLAKFLFKELAVPGSLDYNELILQGRFSDELINKRIEDYVKEFVFCQECKKADTTLQKLERVTILKCEACGAKRPVRNI